MRSRSILPPLGALAAALALAACGSSSPGSTAPSTGASASAPTTSTANQTAAKPAAKEKAVKKTAVKKTVVKRAAKPKPASATPAATATKTTKTTAGASPATASTAISVMTMGNGMLMFNTNTLHARAGRVTIHFTNQAPIGHDLSVQVGTNGPVLGATGVFQGGSRTLVLALKPGTYTYFCNVPGHRAAGMQGTLTVS